MSHISWLYSLSQEKVSEIGAYPTRYTLINSDTAENQTEKCVISWTSRQSAVIYGWYNITPGSCVTVTQTECILSCSVVIYDRSKLSNKIFTLVVIGFTPPARESETPGVALRVERRIDWLLLWFETDWVLVDSPGPGALGTRTTPLS